MTSTETITETKNLIADIESELSKTDERTQRAKFRGLRGLRNDLLALVSEAQMRPTDYAIATLGGQIRTGRETLIDWQTF